MADGSVQVALAGAPQGQVWPWVRRILHRRSTLGLIMCLPLIVVIVGQLLSAAISVVLVVMIARLYSQRTGAGVAQASVPSSGI